MDSGTPIEPSVEVVGPEPDPADVGTVIIVLHGGRERSKEPAGRSRLTYLRMWQFSRLFDQDIRAGRAAVWRLRYRFRGWNGEDPVQDAHWALEQAAQRHPGADVILLGHSMGGRVALRVAGNDNVSAVCALAPWLPEGEPVSQLRGRTVLIAHGDRDRVTDPGASRDYTRRAIAMRVDIRMVDVDGDGHAMMRRPLRWNQLVRDFIGIELRTAGS